jgi:hypothetical protein
MIKRKEWVPILSISFVLAIITSLVKTWTLFGIIFGLTFLTIFINIFGKRLMAYSFGAEIEVRQWEFSRLIYYNPFKKTMHGFRPHQRLNSVFAAGFFLPLIIKALTMGLVNWMACLVFEVKPTIYRTARKWQAYQYSEVTEDETAWIAFIGIIFNLLFAIIGILINSPLFVKLNLGYAFWNSLPLGNLDGMKMYFGRKSLWITSMIITSIGIVLSLVIA